MEAMDIVKDIIYIIITSLALPLTVYLVSLLRTKISEIAINTQDETLKKYIEFAEDAISKAVVSVNQTYVESLKKSGKFDKEAQIEAKNKAIEIAKKLITQDIKEAIATVYGDFETYLDATTETIVNLNK